MQKLLVFVLLLAVARSENDLKKYEGYWTGVMLYADFVTSRGCETLKFEATNEFCKCGQEQVERLAFIAPDNSTEKHKVPVIFVDSADEIADAYKTASCKCDGKEFPLFIFFPHGNKYLSMYTVGYPGGDILVLLAKDVTETAKPTVKEIEDIVEHAADLKGKDGDIICSSDGPTEEIKKKAGGTPPKMWHQLKN